MAAEKFKKTFADEIRELVEESPSLDVRVGLVLTSGLAIEGNLVSSEFYFGDRARMLNTAAPLRSDLHSGEERNVVSKTLLEANQRDKETSTARGFLHLQKVCVGSFSEWRELKVSADEVVSLALLKVSFSQELGGKVTAKEMGSGG
jgi:hypothetical protein